MSFLQQFGRKWHKMRWKSHHFLSKCHGNSMTWTCPKSMSCLSMEDKHNLDKWDGKVMEFGVNLDQTAVDLWHELTGNFHECPCHIFYRDNNTIQLVKLITLFCKYNGNLTIFLQNSMKIPWLELVQNPCHVWAWKTNKTYINDIGIVMAFSVNFDQTAVDLSHDMKFSWESMSHSLTWDYPLPPNFHVNLHTISNYYD